MDFYFDSYSELSLQRMMVTDLPRTNAFAAAIAEVVSKGDHVLDVGTGSGLLAMLAAKAGAEKVFALDQSDVIHAAKIVIEANQLQKTVEAIHTHAKSFQAAEGVDLIVSEWLGHFAFVEHMLDDVIAARDENLKPDGIMLPSHVSVLLAPLSSPALFRDEGPAQWSEPVHGLDFSVLEELELRQAIGVKTNILQEDLLTEAKPLYSLDLKTAKADDQWQSGSVTFTAPRDATLDGFGGWFEAVLSPSVTLDTSPNASQTHWRQTYFPIHPIELKEGQTFRVDFDLKKHPVEQRSLEFTIALENDHRYRFLIG